MRRNLLAAGAAALLLACAQAGATGSASAEASTALQFTLVDLNPGDGIAPWISFGDGLNYSYAFAVANGVQDFEQPVDTAYPGSRIVSAAAPGGTTAVATANGELDAPSVMVSAGTAIPHGSADTLTVALTHFMLAPNTELIVSGVLRETLSTSDVGWTSAANSEVFLGGSNLALGKTMIDQRTAGGFGSPLDVQFFTNLDLVLLNATGSPESGVFTETIESTASTTIVPEPVSALMLAAGLIGIGVAAWLRSRTGCS